MKNYKDLNIKNKFSKSQELIEKFLVLLFENSMKRVVIWKKNKNLN